MKKATEAILFGLNEFEPSLVTASGCDEIGFSHSPWSEGCMSLRQLNKDQSFCRAGQSMEICFRPDQPIKKEAN